MSPTKWWRHVLPWFGSRVSINIDCFVSIGMAMANAGEEERQGARRIGLDIHHHHVSRRDVWQEREKFSGG